MVFTAALFGAQHEKNTVKKKPARSLVVSLDKALNETGLPPFLRDKTGGGATQSTLRGGLVRRKTSRRARATTQESKVASKQKHDFKSMLVFR